MSYGPSRERPVAAHTPLETPVSRRRAAVSAPRQENSKIACPSMSSTWVTSNWLKLWLGSLSGGRRCQSRRSGDQACPTMPRSSLGPVVARAVISMCQPFPSGSAKHPGIAERVVALWSAGQGFVPSGIGFDNRVAGVLGPADQVGRCCIADGLSETGSRSAAAGVEQEPGAVGVLDDRSGPGGDVVERRWVAANERVVGATPVGQVGGDGVADGRAEMSGLRVIQRPGGVQEEQVVMLSVVGGPEVPHPGVGKPIQLRVLSHSRSGPTAGVSRPGSNVDGVCSGAKPDGGFGRHYTVIGDGVARDENLPWR